MNPGRPGSEGPFVDRPVTDPAAAASAAHTAAEAWGLTDLEPWRRGMNAIFRSGDVVLRVGHVAAPPSSATRLAEVLLQHGVRVPRPARREPLVHGDLAVTAWERLETIDAPADWEEVGSMIARVHALDPARLPDEYPLADPRRLAWWDFDSMLADLGSELDDAARRGIERAVERNRGWRGYPVAECVVCHGDVHPGNVTVTDAGAVLLDWDLMSLAPRGWDHGPLMTWRERWGGGRLYEPFAAGYGWSGRGDPFAESVAELRLVAATLMRVRAALTVPGARAEAESRLRFWRGEPDAPAWTAQ